MPPKTGPIPWWANGINAIFNFFLFVINVQDEVEDVHNFQGVSTISDICINIVGFTEIFLICAKFVWNEPLLLYFNLLLSSFSRA